ncbi:MAG: thiamine diphosphokinase [Desulfobacterales bacterium]
MRRAFIFANGRIHPDTDAEKGICPGDMIIAADGGALHCLEKGIVPDLAVGDFDSLSPPCVKSLQEQGTEIRQYPAQKDQTDLELALDAALEKGAEEIIILGALGGRWDMTLANIMLLGRAQTANCRIRMMDRNLEMQVIRSGQKIRIRGRKGDMLSLIPLAQDAEGVSLEGLEYPLCEETLKLGSTRGISNVMLGTDASASLRKGMILCIRQG